MNVLYIGPPPSLAELKPSPYSLIFAATASTWVLLARARRGTFRPARRAAQPELAHEVGERVGEARRGQELRRRAQAALRDANLKGLGAPGDLVVGLPAVAVLERRLTRALVADLRVTRAVALNGAYFASPPGEDALVITGPPRSGTTLLLELLACDEETWRPLTGPEALVPCDDDSDVLTSALAGQALAFQATKEAHYEEVDGPTECRSLLENAGAPYVFWWLSVRKINQ